MNAMEQSVGNRPAFGSRQVAIARHGADERHLHLSAVLEQIRDDGPALAAGSMPVTVEKTSPAEALVPGAAANDANTPAPALQAVQVPRQSRYLPVVCLLLAVSLACSVGYSMWLQMRIASVELQVEVLAKGEQRTWLMRP